MVWDRATNIWSQTLAHPCRCPLMLLFNARSRPRCARMSGGSRAAGESTAGGGGRPPPRPRRGRGRPARCNRRHPGPGARCRQHAVQTGRTPAGWTFRACPPHGNACAYAYGTTMCNPTDCSFLSGNGSRLVQTGRTVCRHKILAHHSFLPYVHNWSPEETTLEPTPTLLCSQTCGRGRRRWARCGLRQAPWQALLRDWRPPPLQTPSEVTGAATAAMPCFTTCDLVVAWQARGRAHEGSPKHSSDETS